MFYWFLNPSCPCPQIFPVLRVRGNIQLRSQGRVSCACAIFGLCLVASNGQTVASFSSQYCMALIQADDWVCIQNGVYHDLKSVFLVKKFICGFRASFTNFGMATPFLNTLVVLTLECLYCKS